MSIKRYTATKTTTITNAYTSALRLRATGSNMGQSDSVEIFYIYGQASSGSQEYSRSLFEFPISTITTDRAAGTIPASGSVNYYLRLFNAKHPFTVPKNIILAVNAVSQSWDVGNGLDMEEYVDLGITNWETASSGSSGYVPWSTGGGDYYTGVYTPGSTLPTYSTTLTEGIEDVELDVTSLVEEWLAGTKDNNGIGVYLTSSIESSLSSSYTKKFFARNSEFFYKRPTLEARWDSSVKDGRAKFYASSSVASAADNLNVVYFYNVVRGQLTNLPSVDTGAVYVQVWTDSVTGSQLTSTPVTGGYVSTGIYSASFALDTTSSTVYDRWLSSGLTTVFHTGTINVKSLVGSNINSNPQYYASMPHLKKEYSSVENARLRLYTRTRDWSPTIYTVSSTEPEIGIIDNVYYRIARSTDELTIVDYGTSSVNHTRLSHDMSGSYFDFDMNILEPGFMYELSYVYAFNSDYVELPEKFKFRVV